MSRRLVATIVVALAVAGCGDDRVQSPTSPELVRGGNCQYNDLKRYARDLFGTPSDGYSLAQAMSGYDANSPEATELAFDIFAAIADKRRAALADPNDADVFTAANITDAASLTVQAIACADVSLSGPGSATIFQQALAFTGGYEVRGDATKDADLDNVPVTTGDGLSGVNTPVIDEEGTNDTFSNWLDVRTLFYGRPISTFSSELSNGRAYDWSIVQPGSSLTGVSSPGLVSICIEIPDEGDLTDYRVEHQVNTLKTILPFTPSETFLSCPAVLPTLVSRPGITDRLIRLLAPQPAYAFALAKTGSPTGSPGSFSPFEAVNPVQVNIKFDSEPRDSRKNEPLVGSKGPVSVKVTGDKGTNWQAVLVQVYGINNNGEKVQFSGDTEETNEAGLAVFTDLSTNKTGGYKLVAKTLESNPGSVSFSQDSVVSRRFNVRP